jgi:hypothetical protein
MKIAALVLGLLLAAVPAIAADVDGKWAGSITTPAGDVPVGFTFKADGTALTGTTTGPDGSEIAIKNGKIDGANITFVVALDFGGMPFEIGYKGVVSASEIKLTLDFMGIPVEMVVKKTEDVKKTK